VVTTAVFDLVLHFYHGTEIGDVANAVSACADQPKQTNKRQLFRMNYR